MLIAPGGTDSSAEHTGHCAEYPGGLALTTGGVSSVPQDSQKLSVALACAPQEEQVRSGRESAVMSASWVGWR